MVAGEPVLISWLPADASATCAVKPPRREAGQPKSGPVAAFVEFPEDVLPRHDEEEALASHFRAPFRITQLLVHHVPFIPFHMTDDHCCPHWHDSCHLYPSYSHVQK